MEPNVAFVSIKLDSFTIFTDFSKQRFRYTISFVLDQKNPTSFVSLLRKYGFAIRDAFFTSVFKKMYPRFLQDIGGNNGFSLENSGSQPQFSAEVLR